MSADEAWETFKDQYFGESSDLAEGFKNDNPLAGSDNYEVYLSDVSKQESVVSFAKSLEGVRKVNKSDVVAKTLTSVNKLVGYVNHLPENTICHSYLPATGTVQTSFLVAGNTGY